MLVEEYIKKELGQLMQRLSKLEIQLQDYLQGQGLTKQQLVENIGQSVLGQLQIEFLLREVQKQEEITISDDELQAKLDKLEEKGLEEVDRDNEQQLQFIRAHLRKQKTLDFLLEV